MLLPELLPPVPCCFSSLLLSQMSGDSDPSQLLHEFLQFMSQTFSAPHPAHDRFHWIPTHDQQVWAHTSFLAAEKLEVAKKEFKHLQCL